MIELNTSQREAVFRDSPSLEILGGPGCGKTRVIAARIARLISSGAFRPDEIAALTYTRSMAADLRSRIVGALPEGVPCSACGGTKHLDGYTCGDCFGSGVEGFAPPKIGTLHALAAGWCREAFDGRIAGGDLIRGLGWVDGASFGIAMPEDVDAIVDAVYRAFRKKVRKKDLVDGLYEHGPALAGWPKHTAARQELRLRNLVRYDDLLVMLEVVAGAQPDGAPHLRDRVRCLLVDEAHDLTPRHWRVIESWGPEAITLVGDDAQRIFGFLLRRDGLPDEGLFMRRMRAAGDGLVRLGENYRTQEPIASACAKVRAALVDDGACTHLPAAPMRDGDGGEIVFVEADEDGMSEALVDTVQGLIEGPGGWDGAHRSYDPSEIAILARSWAELDAIGAVLDAAGIPAAPPSDDRKWWGTPAGRIALAIARTAHRGAVDTYDAQTILEALGHTDPEGLIRRMVTTAIEKQQRLAEALDDDEVASAGLPACWWMQTISAETIGQLETLLSGVKPHTGPEVMRAIEIAAGWRSPTDPDFDFAPGDQTIEDLLIWLASDDASARSTPEGHIVLTTFHGAKGLEWPAVVVYGACDGSIPARWDKTTEECHESGRALYVGMTRARDDLRVIIPSELRGKPRDPSPWLIMAGLATENPVVRAGKEK